VWQDLIHHVDSNPKSQVSLRTADCLSSTGPHFDHRWRQAPSPGRREIRMKRVALAILAFIAAVYLWNASWLAPAPENPRIRLIAHRGVHQTFDRSGIEADTCTAERIFPPTHDFIENT